MSDKSLLTDREAWAIALSIMAVGSVSKSILLRIRGISKKRARELVAMKAGAAEHLHISKYVTQSAEVTH